MHAWDASEKEAGSEEMGDGRTEVEGLMFEG